MPEYLRVKQKDTGHELSVTKAMYDFAPDAYEVLDKPATDAGGNPNRAKHKTTVAKAAAKRATKSTGNSASSEAGPVADTDKEQ